jgi:hypothetical protein
LQFSTRDEGLSVTMHSADPGFAPAVAAAASTSAGTDAGNHSANHPDPQASDTPAQNGVAQNTGSGSGTTGGSSGNTPQGDTTRHSAQRTPADIPPPTVRSGSNATDTAGIFA